jgi:hypothetical protein
MIHKSGDSAPQSLAARSAILINCSPLLRHTATEWKPSRGLLLFRGFPEDSRRFARANLEHDVPRYRWFLMTDQGTRRCPRCGRGELIDISFDEGAPSEVMGVGEGPEDAPAQIARTRQIETYSCGHEVIGPRLDEADETELDVERRTSGETTDPPP